jgi:O-acetyl-ADP-ribose deacetylase (regulator of RNase III)
MAVREFPPGFLWGSNIAAHHPEGNNTNTDWWEDEQARRSISEPSGSAIDSYHRFAEDWRLAAGTGQNAIRFLIEWSRALMANSQPKPPPWTPESAKGHSTVDGGACHAGRGRDIPVQHHIKRWSWFPSLAQIRFPLLSAGPYDARVPRIVLVRGDITDERVDAVVNAANSSLMVGGGVDGAIHRKGGAAILRECREIRRTAHPDGLPTGKAVATSAGNLRARWVIHTVGPVFSRSEDRSALLASCHTEALRVADELGARSVAFPAISTGVYGYPLELAAPVAIRAVTGSDTKVEEVRFVLYGEDAFRAFERALAGAA